MSKPHIHFITGKLAKPALQRTLADIAPHAGFDYSMTVLPITVVALATVPWITRHLQLPDSVDRIILPGLCQGDLSLLTPITSATVERGPKDLRDLPDFFQTKRANNDDYGRYDIEILAEINHAPRLSLSELRKQGHKAHDDGADIIDLGCDPGHTWSQVGDAVRALRDDGLRVSLDSFNRTEVAAAASAGAELILSVNQSNCAYAKDWGCEVVAVPDEPATLAGLDDTIERLAADGVRFRVDPILEPIGFGFANSLDRYLQTRRRYPDVEIMMGIGNLTELTDVDSAGVNVVLLGMCQELGIRSVLTTEVINWCRSCVRELDRARRLVHYACINQVLPKHLATELLMLRDPKLHVHGEETLQRLAEQITDRNFRLFAERDMLYVLNNKLLLTGTDPFLLFQQMQASDNITAEHAFYLGYEMAKAVTALTLGKNYVQDQALHWGMLTVPEQSHRDRMKAETPPLSDEDTKTDGSAGR